jgi:hypothetical protein
VLRNKSLGKLPRFSLPVFRFPTKEDSSQDARNIDVYGRDCFFVRKTSDRARCVPADTRQLL